MSPGTQFYITTLLVFLGVNMIACWALNLQYGVTGILNLGFIMFQAIGGYTAAVLSLGPASALGHFQSYVGGLRLPFPIPILAGGAVAGVCSLLVGVVVLRRLRRDYQAILLLVLSIVVWTIIANDQSLFNGSSGLSLIPHPLQSVLGLQLLGYDWAFVGIAAVFVVVAYFFVRAVMQAPLGRTLRAVRDSDVAADALGKDVFRLRLLAFVVGGCMAGVSGGLLVSFIGVWSPGAWEYTETLVVVAAIVIGGRGNTAGVALGALIVPVGLGEVTRFLPPFGPAGLVPALQWVVIGVGMLAFIYWRPKGLIPERVRRVARDKDLRVDVAHHSPVRNSVAVSFGDRPGEILTELGATTAIPAAPSILTVDGLRCEFGGVVAVAEASFSVGAGSSTGIVGPNGAGKSTVLNAIAGYITPTKGRITFAGSDVTAWPSHRLARMGIIRTFQASRLFDTLTALENLLVAPAPQRGDSLWRTLGGRRFWAKEEKAAVDRAWRVLEEFGLAAKASDPAGTLSGGQRRLLEIARALMAEPTLLLLDEPMAGVSPAYRDVICEHLERLNDSGVTMLLIEHELEVVSRLCSVVLVMASGTVIAEGALDAVRAEPRVQEAYLNA